MAHEVCNDQLIIGDLEYSFEQAIRESVEIEALYCHFDLGLIDKGDDETLQREYDEFFGTLPLTSASTSPYSSRSPSPLPSRSNVKLYLHEPLELKLDCDKKFGMSLLSSLPSSDASSPRRSPSPSPSAPHLPVEQSPSPSPSAPPSPTAQPSTLPVSEVGPSTDATQFNSKQQHDRKKSWGNRSHCRWEEHERKVKNSTPHPNTLKHIMAAERTSTTYDTNSPPSVSTGFIARPDTQSSEDTDLRHLLRHE